MITDVDTSLKLCTTCRLSKPRSAFSRNHTAKDGLAWKCKTCFTEYFKSWSAANADKLNAEKRRWAKNNPEKSREAKRAWRRRNPGHQKALVQKWSKANRAKCRARVSRWRARKRGAFVGDPKSYVAFVEWARTAKAVRCYWCKARTSRARRHLDHIIALSRGGSDSVGNLCVSCSTCNQSKNARSPQEFCGQSELSF